MRRRALVLAPLVATSAGLADEETALYFLGRAKAALADGDLDKAEEWIERTLGEEKDYAPALLLRSEVAQKRGRPGEAVQHLERCLEQERSSSLTDAERRAVREARLRLKKLDAARFEFQAMVDAHTKKVIALAEHSEDSDPELARECWRSVLLVDPGNQTATERLAGHGAETPLEEGREIFNGNDLSDWTGREPAWTVKEGHLFGRLKDAANVNRFKEEVTGDYSILCEMRVLEDLADDPLFGIVFGLRSSYDQFGLWIFRECWRLEHQTGERERDELYRKTFRTFKGKYDRFAWNTYRIDVEGKRITCSVNGAKIWSTSGAVRSLDGYVGCWIQEQSVEIRKFVLISD